MKEKSEVIRAFKQFLKLVTDVFQSSILIFRIENGKEYYPNEIHQYLQENEIVHQSSYMSILQQNEIAKRKNRHLLEVAGSIIFVRHVPTLLRGSNPCDCIPYQPCSFRSP